MHTDKVWIVIVLLIVILVGSNLFMFAWVRGMRGTKIEFWRDITKGTDSMQQQDKSIDELNRRVRALKEKNDDDDDGFKL
jgi:hypothetical protein